MACALLVICFLLSSFVIVESQDENVACYTDLRCADGVPVMATIDNCCVHISAPFNYLAYTVPGVEGCNSCPLVFGFFDVVFSGKERGEAYFVLVGTISGSNPGFVLATITLQRITAGIGDVDLSTNRVTVISAPVSVSFTFTKDSIAQEVAETFTLTLARTGGSSLERYTPRFTLKGEILDDDIALFRLSENDYRENEKPNAMMPVKITKEQNVRLANPVTFRVFPLTVAAALARSLNVPAEARAMNADSPIQALEADFNTTVFDVIFPADENANTVADIDAFIPVVDDEINENEEQLFIVLMEVVNATNPGLLDNGVRNITVCRIIDNDPITIGFEHPRYTYIEPEQQIVITEVDLVKDMNRVSEQTFTILIRINDPSGASINPATEGSDYCISGAEIGSCVLRINLLFPPNLARLEFTFMLLPDENAEGSEGFTAMSSSSENSVPYSTPNVFSGVSRSATIIINDDDPANVGFERTVYSVEESAGSQEVCITVTNPTMEQPLGLTIIVLYNTVSGSADAGDFTAVSSGLGFLSGPGNIPLNRRMCVQIDITDDDVLEDVQSFTLLLMTTQLGVIVFPNVTEIRILDDDVATIGFLDISYTVIEGSGIATVRIGVLSGKLERDVPLMISLSDNSATLSSDYLDDFSNNGMIILNADNPVLNVSFSLVDDLVYELTESLSVILRFQGPAVPRVTLAPSSADITILDEDVLEFGFVPSEYTVTEVSGSATLQVNLISGAFGGLMINLLAATDSTLGTATAGQDYTALVSSLLEYSAAITTRTLDVQILNDDVAEILETFFVQLTDVVVIRAGNEVFLSTNDRSRIRFGNFGEVGITDNDVATLGFRPAEYTLEENRELIEFSFGVLDGELGFSVELEFFTTDGTAISSSDYVDINGIFLFLGTQTSTITVDIINDASLEGQERFFGNLRFQAANPPSNVILEPAIASADIIDDDEVVIGFDSEAYTIDESDGEVIFNVTLIRGILTNDIQVEFFTSNGNAEAPKDYLSVIMTLTFGPSQSFNLIKVPVAEDIELENNEIFNGNLRFSSESNVNIDPDIATATILDNDEVLIGFFDDYVVTERVNSTVTIELGVISGKLGREVVVSVSTQDASATAPGDYLQLIAQLVTFTPTQSSGSIIVAIVDDDISEEPSEDFRAIATLMSTNAVGLTILPEISIITILDDEELFVGFDSLTYEVVENEQFVDVTIVLNGLISRNISITLRTRDGSAVSIGTEADFESRTQVLTFQPSQLPRQTMLVRINIIDDMLVESTEILGGVLTLTTTDGAINLIPSEASIAILDDDAVVIGFDQTLYSVVESANTADVIVRVLSGDLRIPVVVTFGTTDNTAIDGSDYSGLIQTLTFNKETTSLTIGVPIINNDIHEGVERFFGRLTTSENSDVVMLNPRSTEIEILDNDEVTFTFRQPVLSVFENVGEVTVFIDRNGTTDQEFILMLAGSLQAETGAKIDGQITFTPTDSEAAITFTVVDDLLALEPTESLMWTLTLLTMRKRVSISPFNTTEIRIVDDDELFIGFDQDAYEVDESAGFVDVSILMNGRTTQDILISLTTTDELAISSGDEADYVLTTQVLTFSVSGTDVQTMVVRIPIINDNLVEFRESFNAVLTLVTSDPAITLQPSKASIDIIDNDVVVIGFDPSTVSVSEDGNSVDVTILVLSGELRIPSVVVTFTTADNTALDGSDYSGLTQTLTFDQDITSFTISVPILNNDIHEFNEDFFGLLTTSESSDIVTLEPASATIEILDDDVVTFTFRESVQTVVESVGEVTVYIDRSGTTDEDITLMVTGPLQDETNERIDREITFSSTDSEMSITFIVIDDTIALEPTENLLWTLTLVTMGNGASISPSNTADVQIVDDDELVLRLIKTVGRVSESENAEVCISFSNVFAVNFNIDVSTIFSSNVTVDGIATPGTDFMSPDSPILAEANIHGPSTDLCFDLDIVDDNAVEVEECFSVSISLPSPESDNLLVAFNEGSDTSLCCIIDNDVVVIGFIPDTYTVFENAGSITFTIAILSGTLQRSVEVFFSTSDGTATSIAPLDYNSLTDVPLQFDASTSSREITVILVDDDILENSETFFGNLRTNVNGVDLDFQMATVTILEADGDEVTVGFSPEDYTVNEVDGSVILTAMLIAGTLEREVTVQFSTVAGSATETDYEARTFDLTFSSTISQVDIPVAIFDDATVEGSEDFRGALQAQGTPVTVIASVATVVITEDPNDRVTIGFEQTTYSTNEGVTVQVCAIITSGTLERDVEVDVTSRDLTATSGEDYQPLTDIFIFTPQSNLSCIDVLIIDDVTQENEEDFTLILTSNDNMVELVPDVATVRISDIDQITVGLETTLFSVTEGDDVFVEVCAAVVSGGLERNAEVELSTLDGTAMAPGDYTALIIVLTFTPTQTRVCKNISIGNDVDYENSKDFQVALVTTDIRVDLIPDGGVITIEDNDVIIIGFVLEMDSVMENTPGYIDISVRIMSNGMLQVPVVVSVLTNEDVGATNAAESGSDFSPATEELTFTPTNGDMPLSFRVNIIDDNDSEGTEVFLAQLTTVQDRVLLQPNAMTIEIGDEDVTTIGFINPPYSGSENEGITTLTVAVVSGNLETDLVVSLITEGVEDGATESSDYLPVNELLTFNAEITTIQVNVTLINDDIVEGNENFRGRLSIVTAGSNAALSPSVADVTIMDDDTITIGVNVDRVTVDEDVGMVELCASAVGDLQREVVVSVAFQDKEAVGGDDYEVSFVMLTFAPGMLQKCFNVIIIDDNLYENPEEFLANITTTDPQVLISPMTTIVTIVDNDVITIGFVLERDSVMENTPGYIDIYVRILNNGILQDPVVVSYLTNEDVSAPNAAQSGSDFSPASGQLTFVPANQDMEIFFRVDINDDSLSEGPEVFLAQLATVQDRVLLVPNAITIEIGDEDVTTIGFISPPYSGSENEGITTLTVGVVSGNLETDLVVSLITEDVEDGATESRDYLPVIELLTFNAEITTIEVDVTLINDDIVEGNEIFRGRLSIVTAGSNAALSSSVADITIVDDDTITIGVNVDRVTVDEDVGMVELCANAVGDLQREVVVSVAFRDKEAIGGDDYEVSIVMLTFAPGMLQKCFNVIIIDDNLYENPEEFLANITTTDPQVLISPMTTIVTIVDNDVITIGFVLERDSVMENTPGYIDIYVRILNNGILQDPVVVSYLTNEDVSAPNAAQSGSDFSPASGQLTFVPANQDMEIFFRVDINDDSLSEGPEVFLAQLATVQDRVLLVPNAITIEIGDEDVTTIGFINPPYSGSENEGITTLTVGVVSGNLETDLVVSLITEDVEDGATESRDYLPVIELLTFNAEITTIEVDVTLINDDIVEGNEIFRGRLSIVTAGSNAALSSSVADITIVDDDTITIGVNVDRVTVDEDVGMVELCANAVGDLQREVVVSVAFRDKEAIGGDDYEVSIVMLTFAPGMLQKCFNVIIIDDNLYENPEEFLANITTTDPQVLISPMTTIVTIVDNDVITIGFVLERDSVMENTPGYIDVSVRIMNNGILQGPVVVSYLTNEDVSAPNAAQSGSDFSPATGELTFTPANGDMPLSFRVNITDDNDSEGTEVFLAQLTTDQDRVLLVPNAMTIEIGDEDGKTIAVTTIGFINPPYSGSENEGITTLTVGIVSGNLETDLVVSLITEGVEDGATESSDYLPVIELLTFNAEITTIQVNVTLINDDIVEGNEIFRGRLSIVTAGSTAALSPSIADITIVDDDTITIGVNMDRVTVDEGVGMLELCASAVGNLQREVVVSVAYQNRGAIGGDDYEVSIVMLTFAPEMLQKCFNVTIIDDDLYENPEELFVNITTTDRQVNISPMTTVVTILDNDQVVIGWEMILYTQSESDGPVELCAVILSGTLAVTIPAIDIQLVDGSAVRGDDYVDLSPSNRLFSFSSTTGARMCISIDIVNDDSFEIDVENFLAILELVSDTPRVAINPSAAEIQINDEDIVVIGFDPVRYNIVEGDGPVSLMVGVISGSLSIDVQVVLDTSDDEAIADGDYNTLVTSLTFSSSVSSQSVNIIINDDDLDENNELFNGNLLSSMNPRVQIGPGRADILIIDNDKVTIGFEMPIYRATENDTSITEVCARVITPPTLDREIVVTFVTEDNTATAPSDYIAVSMVLTFDQENPRRCIQIRTPDDGIIEGPERFIVRLTSDNETLIPDTTTIEIEERGAILVRFDLPSYTFNEDEGTVSITVVKVGSTDEPITVRVTGGPSMQIDVINSAPGIDETITFDIGDVPTDSIQISLTITDDLVALEDIETYTASLEIISGTNIAMLGVPDETVINIIDNDVVTVNFGTPNISVPESSGTFTMCLVLDKAAAVPVIVDIGVQEGSATDGSDFIASKIPAMVTIPVGDLQFCFTTDTIEDDLEPQEPDESFTIIIISSTPMVMVGTTGTTEIVITDDDVITVRFERPTFTFIEAGGLAEVCLIKNLVTSGSITITDITTSDISTTVGSDYIGGPYSVTFGPNANDKQCIGIVLLTDSEDELPESFTITLNLAGNDLVQPGNPSMTTVTIEDIGTQVNDTVIGDPLYTVPILVPDKQLAAMNVDKLSLCYEVHGQAGKWFNLVTDQCASVNTHYSLLRERLNIMDCIGVRAVDNANQCVNIGVNVSECAATVNGAKLTSMGRYSAEGVNVRRYKNRVRISVPNCAELTLVMWVICEKRILEDPNRAGMTVTGEMIKFVVMRGLNFGHRRAHGLLGQFWNIPIDVKPYSGQFADGNPAKGHYIVNITSGDTPRSYIGFLYQFTWDHTAESCLYVGNTQSGPVVEFNRPNDPVIASIYTEYEVPGAYSEAEYNFGLFNEVICSN